MPQTSEILNDGFLQRYGYEDMFRVYYTCYPVDKQERLFECLKGKFDECYSEKFFWIAQNWKTVSVPKLLPQRYHLAYIANKENLQILQVHQK